MQDTNLSEAVDCEEIAPVAELQTINYMRIATKDQDEAAKLFQACQTDGFFYLDLHHPDNRDALDIADAVYSLSEKLFALDKAEKLSYDVDKLGEMKLNGYHSSQSLIS